MIESIEAKYYQTLKENRVKCILCPNECVLLDGKSGLCGVRTNNRGTLFTSIYGQVSSIAMDPIEKKPLYHFYPGSNILSIGTKGCNFECSFCQNWNISQDLNVRTKFYKPEEIVNAALQNNSVGIAYTYSEPFIWFEYILDCSRIAKENGLKNVFVTNGFINSDPLENILTYADAMNIDLKSFREKTYNKICRGKLHSVKNSIQMVYERCHLELTTLIITGINDDISEMIDIIDWISSIDNNIPWHISRYFPNYKYNEPPTDIDFMMRVYEEAKKSLNFVYCGNLSRIDEIGDTVCPSCKTNLISRQGYSVEIHALNKDKCQNCGYQIYIKT